MPFDKCKFNANVAFQYNQIDSEDLSFAYITSSAINRMYYEANQIILKLTNQNQQTNKVPISGSSSRTSFASMSI